MRNNFINKGLVTGIILLFIGASIVTAFNEINTKTPKPLNRNWLYVGGGGPGNYTTIQEAINNASNGDNLFVFEGFYEEQINVDKSLKIEGENKTNTYIHGGFYISNDNVIIQNFNITYGYMLNSVDTGSHYFGLYVLSSNNSFYNNIFWNISGDTGDYTENGGNAAGIYLNNCSNNNVSNNVFSKIFGGTGGNSEEEGYTGGIASGIYLLNCKKNSILKNTIDHIYGGPGGYSELPFGGTGGNGGTASGIYLLNCDNNYISQNTIGLIQSGTGAGSHGTGGDGGIGTGIFFDSSTLNYVLIDTIFSITGGNGGSVSGMASENGGIGGNGIGCFLISSSNNNITINDLCDIKGGNGGAATHFGGGQGGYGAAVYLDLSTTNYISLLNIRDIAGGAGGASEEAEGGQGGSAIAIYLDSSSDNDIIMFNANNVVGGLGGFGGNQGGSGNIGCGIYLQTSNNNNIIFHTSSAIKGGDGGTGGYYSGGNGGLGAGSYISNSNTNTISSSSFFNISGGIGDIYGYNGTGYGIYLQYSSNNLFYHNNLMNNEQNAYDAGSNLWYNTTLHEGNYWSDYTGSDSDGDGIGDTPYNIPGGSNQDVYPFMESNGWVNEPPIANFTYTINGLSVTFNASSSYDPDGTITTWIWDFGDLTGIYGEIETHNYSSSGTYNVILLVIDNDGDQDSITQEITVEKTEFKKAIIFGKYANLTLEVEYITIEAVNLRIILLNPFQWLHYINGEKITFVKDTTKWIILPRFMIGIFDVET
jgi:nitrous oxidase accessory protein NosD